MKRLFDLISVKITFKRFLIVLFILYLVSLYLAFFCYGQNNLFDIGTLFITTVFVLVFVLFLIFSRFALFVQISVFAVFSIFFIFFRILFFVILPERIKFPFGTVFTSNEINYGLWYAVIGTFLIMAGFFCADFLFCFKRKMKIPERFYKKRFFNAETVVLIFFITIVVDFFILSVLGVNFFNKFQADNFNPVIQLLLVFFNVDIGFFMLMIAILTLCENSLKKSKLIILAIVSFVYVVFVSFFGFRNFGLRILFMLVVSLLSLNWKFKASFIQYISFVFVLCFASLLTYPLITNIRSFRALNFKYNVLNSDGVKNVSGKVLKERDGVGFLKLPILYSIADRMGVIDYEISILSIPPDQKAKIEFINIRYITKSIINTLVPGVVFKDASISTSRLIAILYRGFSLDYVKSNGYFSEFYTPWGIFFLLFGWWGGLVGLFICGFLIHSIYLLILYCSKTLNVYLGGLYLLIVPSLFYGCSGIDHWISNSVILFISGLSVLGFFWSYEKLCVLFNKFRTL